MRLLLKLYLGVSGPDTDDFSSLVSRDWLEKLMNKAVSKIIMLIRTQSSDDCKELNEVKKIVLGLCKCLESYGFEKGVSDVESILPELCRQHNSGLLRQYGDLFTTSLSDDSLVPIKVQNLDEEETFSSFTYASILLKRQSTFPKSLPFSKSILVIHHLLQRFIKSAFDFCHDLLANQGAELTGELSRSVESLLQRNLRSIMQKQLTRETSLKLAQILQFVTNVTHMERSVRDVEAYIRKVSC